MGALCLRVVKERIGLAGLYDTSFVHEHDLVRHCNV